jgi:AAA domain (dynein-related subfamily)
MSATETTVEALGVAVAARVPVLLWGAPGTGKTSAVRAMSQELGWRCESVIASIREPSDFAGLPVVADGRVAFAPPVWARRLAEDEVGILFLDEISTAPPAVQAALLRVVLERVVGDLELPEGVVVIAAANPPEQAADGWDLSAPLANRFCHLDWPVESQAFAEGLTGGWGAPVVPRLPDGWDSQLAVGRGLVSAFVSVRPALTVAMPEDGTTAGRGWPSPRSWEMAALLWTAATVSSASEQARAALVMGCVGQGAGLELLSWASEMDLPDPEEVLADPGAFLMPERGDRAYAALSAIAAAVAANPTEERWLAAWKVLAQAAEKGADVAALAARVLAQCRPEGVAAPAELKRFAPVLREAGLFE